MALAMILGPLSERMKAGSPLWRNRDAMMLTTSSVVIERSTSMLRRPAVFVNDGHQLQPRVISDVFFSDHSHHTAIRELTHASLATAAAHFEGW
jgi:hypothetical protein